MSEKNHWEWNDFEGIYPLIYGCACSDKNSYGLFIQQLDGEILVKLTRDGDTIYYAPHLPYKQTYDFDDMRSYAFHHINEFFQKKIRDWSASYEDFQSVG
jgi:hypothetical protein